MTGQVHAEPGASGAKVAVFAPLASGGRVEQVAQRLMDAILLGVLAPGDRLPSEAELAKRFGVALVTARDGLGVLRDEGLVETRRGREGGSFVLAPRRTADALLRARIRGLARVEIADFGVYLSALTAACAERAANVATEEEIARLRSWLDDSRIPGSGEDDAGTPALAGGRTMGGFHLELAVLSQSPRLVREQIRLQSEFGPILWLAMADAPVRVRVFDLGAGIADAIGSRDSLAARAAVNRQIGELTNWLLAAKEKLEREEESHVAIN
ncbi:FadR family transcriptional regulator [Arthrobacter livingstonensis]|uniref:FadR family transcriptional regulator n=1 Tax=Arthrobacter livingstonensis TaxID=670078 RepID=A0A2V5LQC8_9MICC|nr:GntR family transcriptional regulator [Arthrobacter livingstonensis]PYI64797.1 FadR family transcriptional regulator [Arthrobacter livingstonensis]